MYSFGGLRRAGAGDGDVLPPGITESELMAITVGPDLDSTTIQACLKELKEQCLYLHYDGVRYCFKKDPNVTLLVDQEADSVARDEVCVRARIKEMLEERLAGQRTAIVWPSKPGDIPDNDPSFLIGYMPFELGSKSSREVEATEFFERAVNKQREYRNGVGLAVPSEDQIEVLRRAVRYLLAIEQVRSKSKQLNLTDAQKDQLKERESTERAAAESALLKLYTEVWLPRGDNGSISIEKIAVGGRPLQTTLDEKKRALIHQRVTELIATVQPRVFGTVTANKIADLFMLGQGDPPKLGLKTSEIVAGFYSFLGYPRLTSETVIRRAIAQGIEKGVFGYTTGTPTLGPDGRYQVDRTRLRFERTIGDDEVNLSAGFVVAPVAIPPAPSPTPTAGGESTTTTTTGGPEGTAPVGQGGTGPTPERPGRVSSPPPGPGPRTSIELELAADRNGLFAAWPALANLADLAGQLTVVVRAESPSGLDKHALEHAVLDPLRELGMLDDDDEKP
jgi:hypothetical protein